MICSGFEAMAAGWGHGSTYLLYLQVILVWIFGIFNTWKGFLFIVVPSYTKSRLFQDVFRIFFVTDYFYQDKRDLIREVFVPILQIRLGQTWFTPYDSLL